MLYFLNKKYNGGELMSVAKISQKGWVVIPAEMRRRYGWKPGDRVRFVDYGGVVSLVPVLQNPVEQGMGILKGRGGSLVRALEIERGKERKREHRRR